MARSRACGRALLLLGLTQALLQGATLRFNGVNDQVVVGDQAELKMTAAFTLEAWILPTRPPAAADTRDVILGREGEYLLARGGDGTIHYAKATPANSFAWRSTGFIAPAQQWTHLALTFDGSTVRLFAQGTQVFSETASGNLGDANLTLNEFRMGGRQAVAQFFQGQLDEIRVWTVARTGPQIAASFHQPLAGTETGLVAYYRMNEGPSPILLDHSGRGLTGTLFGTIAWNNLLDALAQPVPITLPPHNVTSQGAEFSSRLDPKSIPATNQIVWGAGSDALEFDGVDDFVHVANPPDLANRSFSVEFWAQRQRTNASEFLLSLGQSGTRQLLHLGWRSASQMTFGFFADDLNVPANGLDLLWHHWSFTYDSATRQRRVYQDGVLLGQDVAGAHFAGTGPLRLGRYFANNAANAFAGVMDEVRIWPDVVLAADTIRSWMDRAPDPSHPHFDQLAALWTMEEPSGQVLLDETGHGHDGDFVDLPIRRPGARPLFSQTSPPRPAAGENRVLHLDGVDDHLAVPAGVWFENTPFTLETWVYLDRHQRYARILDFGNGPGADNVVFALSSDLTGQFYLSVVRNGTNQSVVSPIPVPLQTWTHLAATWNNNQATLYLNGLPVAQGPVQAPLSINRSGNFIGRSHFASDDFTAAAFDDLRIWNSALSQSTLQAWMHQANLSLHPNAAALAAQWTFDESGGSLALDTRRRRDASLVNGPARLDSFLLEEATASLPPARVHHVRAVATGTNLALSAPSLRFSTLAPGSGTALAFDGVDDFVRVDRFGDHAPTTEVTVEFWQRIHSVRRQSPFSLEPDLIGNRMQAHTPWANGIVYWDFGNINTSGRLTYTPPVSLVGEWHHFALVSSSSGNFMRLYRNGVLEAQKTGSSLRSPGDFDLILGRYTLDGISYYLDGELDDLRIWNTARSEVEIRGSLNRILSGSEPGLIAYFPMNEGAGLILQDASIHQLYGRLENGPAWIPSEAPVGRPIALTGSPAQVGFGAATLTGSVNGPGLLPSQSWFEYGTTLTPIPNSARNRASFFTIPSTVTTLNSINFSATPAFEQSFSTLDFNAGSGPMWPGGPVDYFAARCTAQLFLPESGSYTFYTLSDDGSQIWIDGQLVVNHDGPHAATELAGSVYLEAGSHQLEVRYFERTQIARLTVSYAGPGLPKQVIPATAFLQHQPDFTFRTPVQSLPADTQPVPVQDSLGGLAPFTRYHYRLVATNDNGLTHGLAQSFIMPHPSSLTALRLDGVNDYLQIDPFQNFPLSSLTVEFWMKMDQPPKDFSTIFSYAVPGADNHFYIDLRNGGQDFSAGLPANGRSGLIHAPVDDGQWHHIALSWRNSDGQFDFYKDGQPVFSTNNIATGQTFLPNGSLVLGQDQDSVGGGFDPTQAFAGELDEIRIWSAYRSAAEIAGRWRSSFSGTEPNLEAYYRLDDDSASMAADSSGRGHAGTLFNGALFVPSGALLVQPFVTTLPASPVLATMATLRGTVNPSGSNSIAYFEYGTTIAYGRQTESVPVGSGIAPLPFSAGLTNLEPGTTYHYRMVAANDAGLVTGEDRDFTTLALGCGWPIASKVTDGSAVLPKHVLDSDGNTYVAGLFSGDATFKSTLHPEGGSLTNAFIGKLARGADWLWNINIPISADGAIAVHAIAVNNARQVLVAGWFTGTATFGTNQLSAAPPGDLFVAQLDDLGSQWRWARSAGGPQADAAHALAIAPNNDILLAGHYQGSATFGSNSLASVSNTRDILVARLDPNGNWLWASSAGGSGTNETALALAATSTGEAILAGHFSNNADFDIFPLASAGDTDLFVARVSQDGQWVLARRGGGAGPDSATALTIDALDQVYLLGRFQGPADYAGTVDNLNANPQFDSVPRLFAAKLNLNANMLWYAQAGTGTANSIAVNQTGQVYLSGDFSISTQFDDPARITLVSSGNTDVFLAQLDGESGAWNWAEKIGSSGSEGRGSIGVDRDGSIVVSGSFQNTVQIGFVLLTSANDRDIFIARLSSNRVFEHNTYVIGQPIPVPVLAQDPNRTDGGAFGQPAITLLEKEHNDSDAFNSFVWSPAQNKLFAVRPVTAVLKWPLTTDVTNTTSVATCVARTVWPGQPQFHVAQAPVELEPDLPAWPLRFLNVSFTTINGAAVDAGTKTFQAPLPGWSVLHFLQTDGALPNPTLHPSLFEVVRSLDWSDPALLEDNQTAIIGEPLSRAAHDDPTGKNGFVFFERAFYDGVGEERAHDRATRTGPILPVNRDTTDPEDDLLVIWYRPSPLTGIAWPDDPVRYLAQWPANATEIVLASGAGSGLLNPSLYPSKRVYHQDNSNLPGFNPNEEHAALYGDVLYALRNDLNTRIGVSAPYTLLKYRNPATDQWALQVFHIVATNATFRFAYPGEAGKPLLLPSPLSLLPLCGDSNQWVSGPGFKDHQGRIYARAAGLDNASIPLVTRYWYPLQPSFFYDFNLDGQPEAPVGACIPWLDRRPGGTVGTPVDITYTIHWPTLVPTLQIGETLLGAKSGLPDLQNFAQAKILFDEGDPAATNAPASLVRLFDPLAPRTLQIRAPGDTDYSTDPGFGVLFLNDPAALLQGIPTQIELGQLVFPTLPYVLRSRLTYDPIRHHLVFRGLLDENQRYGGPDNPLLLPNILSPRERDRIAQLRNDPDFTMAIHALYDLTRNPNRLDLDGDSSPDASLLVGLTEVTDPNGSTRIVPETFGDGPKALTAGTGTGRGYVTIVENDNPNLGGLPVTLHVIRVDQGPFRGDIKVIASDNVFDEKLTLRHSADFGGEPQRLEFQWYYLPAETDSDPGLFPSTLPSGDIDEAHGWTLYPGPPPGPNGYNDITLGDGGASSLLILSDNYFICRYRGYNVQGQTNWSDWVGAIGGDQAQLAEGWVKRVRDGLNPFEARSRDFHANETVTFASMLQQAGSRYEGDIAFNPAGHNLNSIGLIEAYETVLRRARRLSIDATPPVAFQPANDALLLAAGFIADLYLLLGNEAASDAADPTIGFRTASSEYGTLAPSIFAFQNQLDSLLEEELALLRGRDSRDATVRNPPVYNRLFWNFTRDEGEVAYAQTYNITDQNGDGLIDAGDARILFPQGHGDAWGHYLTATKTYYGLLQSPSFDWVPRAESILLSGVPVTVDYLDERKFARAAAAKAKAGAEIVDLTYRLHYVEDPAGQFQGYKDADPDRAWGVSDWAQRAGSASFLDWVTVNAVLPSEDPDPTHSGLTKIDRTTVPEIDEILAGHESVQILMDKADAGLNPLGLAKNVVPFDIDPTQIAAGHTHFEQIYDRALSTLRNAVTVFDHANQLSQALRQLQDNVNDFSRNVEQQERDYKNRLLEIFGYPYAGTIGPGRTYPSGYDGPDIYHYMYINTTELNGDTAPPSQTFTGYFTRLEENFHYFAEDLDDLSNPDLTTDEILSVPYPVSTADYAFSAPGTWGQRRAPGELQIALSELLQSEARMKQALLNYDNLLKRIDDQIDLLESRYEVRANSVSIRDTAKRRTTILAAAIGASKITRGVFKAVIQNIHDTSEVVLQALPKVVGTATDPSFPIRGTVKAASTTASKVLAVTSGLLEIGEGVAQASIDAIKNQAQFNIETEQYNFQVQQHLKEIEQLLRQESVLRADGFVLAEKVSQNHGRYQSALAKGLRLLEERIAFRKNTAADTQANRYQDMTFRIFRNDAIQKYRAQFDLAAQYVYLAAVAYDFETQLLQGRPGAGSTFLTDIVRQRAIGEVVNGSPVPGRHGLADPLARLSQNFAVLKGQLGFNNPQTETGRFSLRHELFRLRDDSEDAWQAELKRHIVPNLWNIPEFRRYCRPFAPESAGPQPGLLIRFPTTITFGLNYFGWPLGGGDNNYDSTLFATKVRSAGVWFEDYLGANLSQTPRVYLVPVGADLLRSPSGNNLETRPWRVVDQKIPVPFPIGFSSLNDEAWIPLNDSLSDEFAAIRRFSSFRAYHDSGFFNPAETISDNRLIGRSVWNTDWMLIIPGGTFLFDPNQGLDTFINSVADIKIFFQTYAYSGN